MPLDLHHLSERLSTLRDAVLRLGNTRDKLKFAASRWIGDAGAAGFHLSERKGPLIAVILGGTGTGKSTLLNRLVEHTVSAASFRRTFTGGAIAAVSRPDQLAPGWLGIPHEPASETPARGRTGALALVAHPGPLLERVTLIDTPDLDGDHAAHHAEADRAFRWAEAVLFVVTPEKYQMPELIPYYRLARRYAIPALFALNKCEEAIVLDDYRQELARLDWPEASVFAIPRDDAGYEPPPDAGLATLNETLSSQSRSGEPETRAGAINRCLDLVGRLRDQILGPLQAQRRDAEAALAALRGLRAPVGSVDVSPLTEQLQRRMQEQSVLYLMGPGRIVERVRSLPTLLSRLPRTAWDVMTGNSREASTSSSPGPPQAPDFRVILAEQFTIVQSGIDDLLRSGPLASWLEEGSGYAQLRLDVALASRIAQEELDALERWLEQQWQQKPRDTRIIQKLVKRLPGGDRLTKWSETAPYLLAIIVATHHAFFGPLDLLILGSFSLATWIGEKVSNEVTSRTRETNRRIAERFDALARDQIERVCAWIEQQLPPAADVARVERVSDRLADELESELSNQK